MNFSCRDGKRLSSRLWHQDVLLKKKRRWLVGPAAISMTDGSKKKFKRPKFLTDVSLRESYVRSDEVSCENVRANVEKSFGAPSVSGKKNHVVKDYLQFFESFNMETYSINPSHFLHNMCSMMNVLSNNALCLVAKLVTGKKVRFVKTRPMMKQIIRDYLPKVLKESSYKDYQTPVEQLSEIFRDPGNFWNKELILLTPVSLSLLSSIQKALEELDEMPLQDLVAMNRKLRDIMVVPQFPPARLVGPRNLVLERVKKKCQKVLSTLKEGANLPKPFAKALSIVQLSLKHRTRRVDIIATEFYPFSHETVGLQNDILGALWLLPRVRIHELKALQPIVDPRGSVPSKTFRIALRKYLMEYLFDCDVIGIPDEALSILASLNRRSRRSARLFSVGMVDEDVEAVLNVSSQLKQTVINLLPADRIDENSEVLGSDDDTKSNDFDLAENSYLSNPNQRDQGFCLNDMAEGTGDSGVPFYSANSTDQGHPLHLTDSYMIGEFATQQHILEHDDSEHITNDLSSNLEGDDDMVGKFIKKLPTMEQDNFINPSNHYHEQASMLGDIINKYNLECDDMHCSQRCPEHASTTSDFVKNSSLDPGNDKDPSQHCPEEAALGSAGMREILIQEICDETSLVAYGLIGHMLDKFLQVEDRDSNEMTRSYLRGGSSLDCPGIGERKNSSKEDMGTRILIQSVKELLPNVSKSCIERVKKLMG